WTVARSRGAWALLSADAAQPVGSHQPLHGAARDRDALPAQLSVELFRAVDAEVLRVHAADLDQQLLVPDRPFRGWSGLEGVVGARRDLGARCGERAADRLDAELVLVLVDELHDQRCGRSSSAAKKAEADLKIALARRSSRTSFSSSASRSASLVVVPGRWPSSISACTTQFLRVSGLIPSCSPTRRNVPDFVAGSCRASTAILVALSRSSSGYFLGAAMLLILPWIQSLHQTRGDSSQPTAGCGTGARRRRSPRAPARDRRRGRPSRPCGPCDTAARAALRRGRTRWGAPRRCR